MTRVLIPMADGVEEIEAVIPINLFRRAGWTVVAAGMTGATVTASRNIRILTDKQWKELSPDSFDILVLPGGAKGSEFLASCPDILALIRHFVAAGKITAAICAAPRALKAAGVLAGKRITCHPAVKDEFKGINLSDEAVVVDGSIVTSRGAGTAFDFALTIISMVEGRQKADAIAESIVYRSGDQA